MCRVDSSQKFNSSLKVRSLLNDFVIKTEYQAIVSTKDETIYAYEALARFEKNNKLLFTEEVFKKIHNDLEVFFELELLLKEKQFRDRPEEKQLFVNFDPHIFLKKEMANEIFKIFSDEKDFVIELVENSFTSVNVTNLVKIFEKFDYKFAIDDFFKENSMVSINLLNSCDYIKLDIDILAELKRNDIFFHIVDGIIKFAHSLNKFVILEGVETKEDLMMAKRRGIDFVQGFLFKEKNIMK